MQPLVTAHLESFSERGEVNYIHSCSKRPKYQGVWSYLEKTSPESEVHNHILRVRRAGRRTRWQGRAVIRGGSGHLVYLVDAKGPLGEIKSGTFPRLSCSQMPGPPQSRLFKNGVQLSMNQGRPALLTPGKFKMAIALFPLEVPPLRLVAGGGVDLGGEALPVVPWPVLPVGESPRYLVRVP